MCQYMYIDTEENLADHLFINEKVPVHFGREFCKDGSIYKIIVCRVRKDYEQRFIKALERLPEKMLLLGHADYQDFCEEVSNMVQKGVSNQVSE